MPSLSPKGFIDWHISSSSVAKLLCFPQGPPPTIVCKPTRLLLHCLGIAKVGVYSHGII